mgnify:CR=1 FL=1
MDIHSSCFVVVFSVFIPMLILTLVLSKGFEDFMRLFADEANEEFDFFKKFFFIFYFVVFIQDVGSGF